ncbi:MAG: hypothetical protein GXY86_16145 [Firmicutes bacterium]|nr:hypothetical protein [Bacillota bacterium]
MLPDFKAEVDMDVAVTGLIKRKNGRFGFILIGTPQCGFCGGMYYNDGDGIAACFNLYGSFVKWMPLEYVFGWERAKNIRKEGLIEESINDMSTGANIGVPEELIAGLLWEIGDCVFDVGVGGVLWKEGDVSIEDMKREFYLTREERAEKDKRNLEYQAEERKNFREKSYWGRLNKKYSLVSYMIFGFRFNW